MFGSYGEGKETLPRVIHITIVRYHPDLPKPGEKLEFLVTIHEEGTGISWQQNITVDPGKEKDILSKTQDLYYWSLNKAFSPEQAKDIVKELGKSLHDVFLTSGGKRLLNSVVPTAILFDVDETILNVPWELIANPDKIISQQTPFGRLVLTRTIPRSGRDPIQEDAVVRILAVANPTMDLAATELEVAKLSEMEGDHGSFCVEVDVLSENNATRKNFYEMVSDGDYDILHFAGHAHFDVSKPESSSLHFADGRISADDILTLPWKDPPYFVFNSACESGRAAGGKRLVSDKSQSNGLAAAFLTAGIYGYAGYFWPVTDVGAALFAETFYKALFLRENVGLAFLAARVNAIRKLGDRGDLTGYSAVLFGDAASKHRRDLAMLV